MGFRWPELDPTRRLSSEEASELAARVAELARAGLPLGAGLRALAQELPGRRVSRVLGVLADRLDAGDDLVTALEGQHGALPPQLRGLMLAGVRSGRLAEVLEEYVDLQRGRSELRWRMAISLAYPFFLLVFLALVAVVTKFFIVDEFARMFRDFGMSLPPITQLVIRLSEPLLAVFVGLLALAAAAPLAVWGLPGVRWVWPILYRVPMLGPVLRFSQLTQFARLMALLLEQQVPLPDALRLSAAGCEASLAAACRGAADDVERGRPLHESMDARRAFPAGLNWLVEWGQQAGSLGDAFSAAAEAFEGQARLRAGLLDSVLLPGVFLVIVTFVGIVVTALLLPLVSLIQMLV